MPQALVHFCGVNNVLTAAVQPSEISNFGLDYGIQIGQVIGFDFGYGIIQDTCAITFVIV